VSGTYSATVVSKLQGAVLNIISPSNGQILRYSGSSWVNGSLASSDVITALGYTPINAGQMPGNCGASQTLTFSSPTGSWFCSTIVVNGSAFATQAQATFLAGPTSGSGTPSFRTIASTDLPASALSQWTTSGSNIYYATSGGNVGLNVSSPTAALHLRAGTSAVGGAPLKFSTGSLLTTPEAGAIEFDGANLYYTNSSSARMVVATAGGTITASAGTATAPSFAFSSDAMSGMFSPGSQTLGITTGGVERIHIDSSGNIAFGAGFTSPQSPFDFVDTVTIRGGGHLGINTSSPSYDLDYQGSGATTYLPSGTGATVPALFTAINNANTQAGDGHGAFYYMAPTNTASVSQTAYIGAISNGGGSYSPTMVFGRATGTSSWAETMRIDGNTGAVGIGTTSPSANLHVRSTSGSAPTFMVQNGSTGGAIVIASGGSAAAPVYQISKISISTSCSPSSLNVGQSVICTASTTASTLNLPSNASSHFLNCYQNGGSNQIVGSGVLNGTALSIAGVAGASGSVSTVVFTCMVTSM
jgi:hypothetical protein